MAASADHAGVIEYEQAIRQASDDPAFLLELLADFLGDEEKAIGNLAAAHSARDFKVSMCVCVCARPPVLCFGCIPSLALPSFAPASAASPRPGGSVGALGGSGASGGERGRRARQKALRFTCA
jgi:hypothetical protein